MRCPEVTHGHARLAIVALVFVIAVAGVVPAAATGSSWSITLSGEVDGAAKRVTPQCTAPTAADAPLLARASFRVGSRRLSISALFASPVAPGPRPFGATADSSTVLVTVSDANDPAAIWISGTEGVATIADDRSSGTIFGTLVGGGGTLEVDASFRCPRSVTGSGEGPDADREEDAADQSFAGGGTVEASVSEGADCIGAESGAFDVFPFNNGAVFASALAEGSYTCPGITIPTAGALYFDGRFKNGVLTLQSANGGMIGNAPMLFGCLVGQTLKIRIRDGAGSASPEYTAPSGDVYRCTFTVESAR